MRIDELKRIAEENGYEFHDEHGLITISRISLDYENIVKISKGRLNCLWIHNTRCDDKDLNVIKAAIDFAETPPEDREEIKKYFYKHNFMKTKGGNPTYLAIRKRPSISYPVLQGSSEDIFEYKVEFTDEEIKKAQMEHGIFLDDFEKNEVKDDQK